MKLYCDNKIAIEIAHNLIQYDHTKHMEIDRHFIKEKLDSGLICIPYASMNGQLYDILTKKLTNHSFQAITNKVGIDNIYTPDWEGMLGSQNIQN